MPYSLHREPCVTFGGDYRGGMVTCTLSAETAGISTKLGLEGVYMPMVGKKKFPYTSAGVKAAKAAAAKTGKNMKKMPVAKSKKMK